MNLLTMQDKHEIARITAELVMKMMREEKNKDEPPKGKLYFAGPNNEKVEYTIKYNSSYY